MSIALINLIRSENLDPDKLIDILESGIEFEKLAQHGNELIHDELRSLSIDQKITQAKILVSLLRTPR
jgi:hypothetical protein